MIDHHSQLRYHDTCIRIGRSRAPDSPEQAEDADQLLATMQHFHISAAAVEHAVAREASPRRGHVQLEHELDGHANLRPAWHLMPHVHARIEAGYTDPDEYLRHRVALGRVDAQDFCNGRGDQACFAPVLEACSIIRLPVFLDFRAQGDRLGFDYAICERWPRIPFVAEAAATYPFHRIVWALQTYPNLYVSTVGLGMFNGVSILCDLVGADRILFGSNWPANSIGMSIGCISLSGITIAEKQQIAALTFEGLLAQTSAEGSG